MKTSLRAIVRNGTLFLGAAALVAPAASATWSIIAVNTRTGEVCIASATCLDSLNLQALTPVMLVGVGGACAQSAGDSTGVNRQRIHDDMLAGMTPAQILDDLAAHDNHHQTRQYGIVNMADEPVTFSGSQDGIAYYGVSRVQDDIRYAIQGNVLTGIQVVTNAENAFLATEGDLGQKVIAAMEAARVYGGDGRCSCNDGAPTYCGCPPHRFFYSAYTAFFLLARMGDVDGATCGQGGCATGTYFSDLLAISAPHGPEPVIELESEYATWRASKAGITDQIRTRVTPGATRIPADGLTQIDVEVELFDIDGNHAASSPPQTVTVTDVSQGGATATIGQVLQSGPDLYSFSLTSNGALGEGRYQITVHEPTGDVLLWPELVVRADPPAEFFSGASVVSSSQGATIPLWLDSGAASAASHFLMIASTSGTVPGTTFGGIHVPLNVDRAFRTSVASAGTPHYPGTMGFLDANGRATGFFVASPEMLYPLVGRHFDWSAVVSGSPGHATLPDGFDVAP